MYEGEDIDGLIDEELEEYGAQLDDDNDDGSLDFAGDRDTDWMAERATIPTADSAVNILRKHFIYHNNQPLKRSQPGSSFAHCPVGIPIGDEYRKLRQLLSEHARLHLQKDVTHRIHQFEIFIRNLKKLVQEETSSWQAINNSKDVELEEHQTNLTALSSICDEFRMHLNHWICIKQRVQNNRWLREILPSIMSEVAEICERFVQLQETAFWWTEKLLKIGMNVFAYVDRRSLTYNDVFSIVRGIEEYNTLILLVRISTQEMRASTQQQSKSLTQGKHSQNGQLTKHTPTGAIDSNTTKSVNFIRLLHSLAFEWAKSAVAITKHFIDSQPLLIETMQSKRCMRIDEPSHLPSRHSPTCGDTRASVSSSPMGTTSDYYSDSMNHRSSECDSGSLVDLTSSASPLLDFGKKERDYISKVIQITCQRTTLLRKNKFTVTSNSGKRSQSASANEAAIMEDPGAGQFIRQDSKRKSVSWGDSHDMSVCRQLCAKYDDALWKAFGVKLEDAFCHELNWSRPGGHKSNLGSLDLCSDGALTVFTESLQHAASKGYFTHHGSQQMSQIISLVKSRAAISSCDVAISKCLASIQKGKTDAIPLHNGQKSTRTAMLLRNAIILTTPQLKGHQNTTQALSSTKGSPSHHNYIDYRIRSTAVNRLQIIIKLTEKWCITKSELFLSSYKIAPFVLITHGDLVILHRGLQTALHTLQSEIYADQTHVMQQQLDKLALFYSEMKQQLCDKASQLTEEIIASQIPKARFWRSANADPGKPLELQSYAENMIDSVLMPVADGAKHLGTEDQVAALATVVDGMCKTWSQYFLKNKIRISLHGAEQLKTDFKYLSNFIETYLTDDAVKSRVLQCSEMTKFNTILSLLSDRTLSAEGSRTSQTALIKASRNRVHPLELGDSPDGTYAELNAETRLRWMALKSTGSPLSHIFPCLPPKITQCV